MIKVYFKQAWQLLRQNKLYSTVYIIGTGLAIAMTMTIAIVYYIKIAPLYPENNRSRTLVAKSFKIEYAEGGMSASSFSWQFIKDNFCTLKTPEVVSATLLVWEDYPLLELSDEKGTLPVRVRYVDNNFWKVFDFNFQSGKPFDEAEFQSGIKTAVISSSLANTLFGTTEAEGMRMNLDGDDYRVSGVVKDVSYATTDTYAQIWVPFTVKPEEYSDPSWGEGILGPMRVYMLAHSASEMDDVALEAQEVINKINNSQEKYTVSMSGMPEPFWKNVFRTNNHFEFDWTEVFTDLGIVLIALLLIPAVNLAGMVSSRMEKRLSEMGIRKSFGASRGKLMNQILTENFLLTALGGVVGLIFSYLIMLTSKNWILTIFDIWTPAAPEGTETFLSMDMLFNPVVFLITLVICFLLNLLSAIIPAYYGLKKNIINSLSNSR